MIKVDNKLLLNLEDTVRFLVEKYNANQAIAEWGIKVLGVLPSAEDLPSPLSYEGFYGDAYAVGLEEPYTFYIWTRASDPTLRGLWVNIGDIAIPGPAGPQGEQGPQGEPGIRGSQWFSGSGQPTTTSGYNAGDYYINVSTGNIWHLHEQNNGLTWLLEGNIKGPQGIPGLKGDIGPAGPIGPQGIQGPRGLTGPVVSIVGELANIDQLPSPTEVARNAAYLIPDNGVYHTWIIIGEGNNLQWVDAGLFATEQTVNFNIGEGAGSVEQVNGGVTGSNGVSIVADAKATGLSATALSARTEANGDASLAQGYNSKAYTKADVALGSSKAGLTEAEFNTLYPDGYLLSGNYLNYEQFKKRVVNAAFSCGNGIANGAYSFATGTNVTGRGSQAQGSATFGNYCVVRDGWFDSDSGPLFAEGKNSLAGGDTVAIHGPNSIGYGYNLILPKRTDANDNLIPVAVFGRYNQYYHPSYTSPTIFEIGNGTSNDVSGVHNAFEVLDDGRVKGFGAPVDWNDFVRLGDLPAIFESYLQANGYVKQ